ncbi:LuxR C-terminal-related transcriptional regulator [Streptomyces sp. NPDC001156]
MPAYVTVRFCPAGLITGILTTHYLPFPGRAVSALTRPGSEQIARVPGLSPRTVEKHVNSAMRKRNAPSCTALAVAAVESGDVASPGSPPRPRPLTE